MAVIFCDGFDWWSGGHSGGSFSGSMAKRWTAPTNTATSGGSGGAYARQGGQGYYINRDNNDGGFYRSFGANYASGLVGFAYKADNAQANRTFFQILDGTSEQISIRTNGSSVPIISRSGTTLATGSTVLSTGTWYYFELKFTINNSTGVVELKLNGTSEIASTSSLNTRSTGNNYFNGIAPYMSGNNGNRNYFDDIYVLDTSTGSNTTFLGPVQVVGLNPAANGNYAQWTPNGGSNVGSAGDLFEDGDTSFNQSSTANQIDTYVLKDLPAAAGSVYAVAHHTVARQDGGSARTMRPKYRIGGSDYNGSNFNTGGSYAANTEYKDVSPATSSAWTVSEVNGMETGYELVS